MNKDFNWFLEIFILRLLWLWLPMYALYRAIRDIMDDMEAETK